MVRAFRIVRGLTLVFCALIGLGTDSFGRIRANECADIDFTQRFGPIRDQDGHGLCSAFAVGALLEEERCLEQPELCRQPSAALSVLDLSHRYWRLGDDDRFLGIHAPNLLDMALSEGVCLETDAPYSAINTTRCRLLRYLPGPFSDRNMEVCANQVLLEIFRDWRTRSPSRGGEFCTSPTLLNESLRLQLTWATSALREALGGRASVDLSEALLASRNDTEFLSKILLGPDCPRNRVHFHSVTRRRLHTQSVPLEVGRIGVRPNLGALLTAFRHASRSVALDIVTSSSRASGLADTGSANHSVVANGMRYNAMSGRCEISVRNSWGVGSALSGWVDADELLSATQSMTYLEED